MKLFWKLFFTTMCVSVLCVTISGYLLINSNFYARLNGEVVAAREYGEIVFYSLVNAFRDVSVAAPAEEVVTQVAQVAQSISIDGMEQKIVFAIVDAAGTPVFSSLHVELDKSLIDALGDESAGWMLKASGDSVYVQTMRPATYGGSLFYIETVRSVTGVFGTRQSQYEMMLQILAGTILCAGVLTFVISKLLMRRITALTEMTRTIAAGDLSRRAAVRGEDEIALLSANFNRMADRLEENIRALKDESERKELFVGAFSHELKTPLTSIIGYADLLRRTELRPEQRHTCADYIYTEGKRLETLSMRLLELIVMKRHTLTRAPVEIRRVLQETAELMLPPFADASIRLVFDAERATISMEPELMKTVFVNLLDNARKAIDGAGTVTLTGRRQADAYVVTIRDTGKGMAQTELQRITDAFYMVDKSRARRQGGAGLGLALCSEIISLHGFALAFDSTVGVGTTVTVTMREGDT